MFKRIVIGLWAASLVALGLFALPASANPRNSVSSTSAEINPAPAPTYNQVDISASDDGPDSISLPKMVRCDAPGSCIVLSGAGGRGSMVTTIKNGVPTTREFPVPAGGAGPNVVAVECEAGLCAGVGSYYDPARLSESMVVTYAAGIWSATALPGHVIFDWDENILKCSAPGECAALAANYETVGGSGVKTQVIVEVSAGAVSVQPVSIPAELAGFSISLQDIACPSGGHCIAVGHGTIGSGDDVQDSGPLAVAKEQGQWKVERLPPPAGASTAGGSPSIDCVAAEKCLVLAGWKPAGEPAALFAYTGTTGSWSSELLPVWPEARNTNVDGLSLVCADEGPCVARGTYYGLDYQEHPIVLTWDDGTWLLAANPRPTDRDPDLNPVGGWREFQFLHVSCGPSSCAGVGTYLDDEGNRQGLMGMYADGRWTTSKVVVPVASVSQALYIQAFACPSPASCMVLATDTYQADGSVGTPVRWVLTTDPVPVTGKIQFFKPLITECCKVRYESVGDSTRVGTVVSAQAGVWGPPPVALSYQWQLDGKSIVGETVKTHRIRATELGKKLSVVVTGTRSGLAARSSTSRMVTVQNGDEGNPIVLRGTAKVGRVMSANDYPPGGPAPLSLTYRWFADGEQIPGADQQTLTVPGSAVHKKISAIVTGVFDGLQRAGFASVQSAIVSPGSIFSPPPRIVGTAKAGATLTAVPGGSVPGKLTYKYQWLQNGKPISGATAKAYTVAGSLVGKKITVTVVGAKAGYRSASRTSAATAGVVRGSLTAPIPKVSGTAKVGMTLKVTTGWRPLPVNLKYQWKQNGHSIPKAVGRTYKITSAMRGKKITVTVTGTKVGYVTAAKTSAASRPVTP